MSSTMKKFFILLFKVIRFIGHYFYYGVIVPLFGIFVMLPIAAFFFVLFAPVTGPIAGYYITEKAHQRISRFIGGLRWA